MKSLLLPFIGSFASILLFTPENLCAQDVAHLDVAPASQKQALLFREANNQTGGQLNFNAGQQLARFEDFRSFVNAHLVYPELARKNNIEGRVEVLLLISDQGKILSAKVVKSLGFGCDEAALAVAGAMPDWVPAMNCGIPVKSKSIVAFDFRLR